MSRWSGGETVTDGESPDNFPIVTISESLLLGGFDGAPEGFLTDS